MAIPVQQLREEILNFQYTPIAENTVDSFKFEGFDAVHIYSLLRARQATFATFVNEMNVLCLIGMMRGTRCDKVLTSISTTGRNALNALITRYGLVPQVPQNNRKNALTIGRVMSVFPQVCLQHAIAGHIRDFGLGDVFDLPVQCRFPQFAALIPSENEQLWEQYLAWANAMDRVIKGNDTDPDLVERFAVTTNRNVLFTQEGRVAILTAAGVI